MTTFASDDAAAMEERRIRGLREAQEAESHGMAILEGLSSQGAQLDHADRLAQEQEYLLARSRRTIRGMTWAGWAANMVTSEPPPPAALSRSSHNIPSSHQNVRIRQVERQRELSGGGGGGGGSSRGAAQQQRSTSAASGEVEKQLAAQDAYLAAQSRNVSRLHDMASTISESVVGQTQQLGDLDGQVERLEEESRAITRMEGRLFRTVRGRPTLSGRVVLQHVESGRLLQCTGDDVHLSATLPPPPGGGAASLAAPGSGGSWGSSSSSGLGGIRPACFEERSGAVWEAWTRRDGVIGLRNCASRRWLGQNLLGAVRVRGTSFSHWEALEMALDKGEAPILSCSANANGGGWLFLRSDGPISSDQPGLEARDGSIASKRAAPRWRIHHISDPKERPGGPSLLFGLGGR